MDRLGSVDYMTDNVQGKVASYIDYDEWGKPLKKNVLKLGVRELDMAIDYTGHVYDQVLGLYYAKARMYSAEHRRFLAMDSHWDATNRIYGDDASFADMADIHAIRQSASLYVYVMGNPIIYIDPIGLFAWNEDNNHWFDLKAELKKVGGTIRYENTNPKGSWIVSVYGVTISFNGWKDGVEGTESSASTPYLRADVFYSTVVAAAKEIIFLGQHGAFVPEDYNPFSHASAIIFISLGHTLYNDSRFNEETLWGIVRYATIGGTSRWTVPFLNGSINEESDRKLEIKTSMQWLHTGVGKAQELFESFSYFKKHHCSKFLYHPTGAPIRIPLLPLHIPDPIIAQGYNSNSYARGLLNSVGLNPKPKGILPGWQVKIKPGFFGR